ncbi:hypothetical protein [Brevibacterium salitolerans]|jgi:hypothetical protein|uniref:Uncharacterized protein n=1 Tax=Brevibacterium salitolerans TaxID=1403566 RepID=A0ABP5HTQ5_9MICO
MRFSESSNDGRCEIPADEAGLDAGPLLPPELGAQEEARFSRLFEDLEAVEAGRELHARAGEYGDLVVGEVADHGLAQRLAGAVSAPVRLTAAGAAVSGVLERAGEAWVRIGHPGEGWATLVALEHVEELRLGVRRHAQPAETLSFASQLRGLSEARAGVALGLTSGAAVRGRLGPVGRDYAEFHGEAETSGARPVPVLLPLRRIAWVRAAARTAEGP